jgi:hypothetical protein
MHPMMFAEHNRERFLAVRKAAGVAIIQAAICVASLIE